MHFMVDFEVLNKDIDNLFKEKGEIIAQLEVNDHRHICLEINGDEKEIWLEIVDYEINSHGVFHEQGFSDCIYDIPQDEKEAKDWLINWLNQD